MKDRAFSNPVVISVVTMVVAILLPMPAFAAVCFQNQFGDTFVIEVAGQGGQFFSLVGELVGAAGGTGIIQPGKNFPLIGSVHLRADGKVHFGMTIHADDPDHLPLWSQGTLDPPSFNTGSGFIEDFRNFASLTLSPASCPTLPQ